MKKLLTILMVMLVTLTGFNSGCVLSEVMGQMGLGKVKVIDAYCVYSITSSFQYNFSLQNKSNNDIDAEYSWSLNDPMADGPRYQGTGSITLKGSDTKDISIPVERIPGDSDPRGCIMYVTIYENGEKIGYYRQQKSTYDWDYSVTPPVKRSPKPDYTHLWIDTLITKEAEGYKITVSDIIFLPSERTAVLNLSNIGVSVYKYPELNGVPTPVYTPPVPLSEVNSPDTVMLYDLRFYDNDNNGVLSIGDYFTADENATGAFFNFKSINEPSIHIYDIDNIETIEEENPDAISITDVSYEISEDVVEFYIEFDSPDIQNLIGINSVVIMHPGENGSSIMGVGVTESDLTVQGNTYGGTIDLSIFKDKSKPLYLFVYLSDGINEAMCVIGKIV
jgi:hypothetical protein